MILLMYIQLIMNDKWWLHLKWNLGPDELIIIISQQIFSGIDTTRWPSYLVFIYQTSQKLTLVKTDIYILKLSLLDNCLWFRWIFIFLWRYIPFFWFPFPCFLLVMVFLCQNKFTFQFLRHRFCMIKVKITKNTTWMQL